MSNEEKFMQLEHEPAKETKGLQIPKEQWDNIMKEIDESEGNTIKIVDLTKPDKGEDNADLETIYSFYVFYKTNKNHKLYKGKIFTGAFTAHYSTHQDQINMARIKAHLRGGMAAESFDISASIIIDQQAILETLLDEKPDWFDVDKLYDYELISLVYEEVMSQEATFRGAIL